MSSITAVIMPEFDFFLKEYLNLIELFGYKLHEVGFMIKLVARRGYIGLHKVLSIENVLSACFLI